MAEVLGRRLPLFLTDGGLRALVPVPLTTRPGEHTVWVNLKNRRVKTKLTVVKRPARTERTLKGLTVTAEVATSLRSDKAQLVRVLKAVSPEALWSPTWRYPVPGPVSAEYGIPRSYGGGAKWTHKGVDFAMVAGWPVIAPTAGVVVLSRRMNSYGHTIVLSHGQTLFTAYLHLSSREVKKGQRVEAGQVIGTVGATGMALGAHVHFGVYIDRVAVDPLEVLTRGLP